MKKILIINSNYYKKISNNLLLCTKNELTKFKFKLSVINVPGVYEIPLAIRTNIKSFDGFVALGCVIKGQPPHFDFICSSTFSTILNIAVEFNKPIGNGIITALNKNQASMRSDRSKKVKFNKGSEAAKAVISFFKNGPKKI